MTRLFIADKTKIKIYERDPKLIIAITHVLNTEIGPQSLRRLKKTSVYQTEEKVLANIFFTT